MLNLLTSESIKAAKILTKQGKLKINDRYKDTNQPKVEKGISLNGELILGYAYNPEVFIKSDISGKLCRYYIRINNITMHPDELYRIKTDKAGNIKLDQDKVKINIIGERTKTIKEDKNNTAFTRAIDELRYRLTYISKETIITIEDTTGNKLTNTREELCKIAQQINFYGKNYTLSEYLETNNI